MKKAIKKACKGVSYPKSSSVSKRLGSPSKAKKGMKVKKAAVGTTTSQETTKNPVSYTNPSGRTFSSDTSGYAMGAKRFPMTMTSKSGKTQEFGTNRKGVSNLINLSQGKKTNTILPLRKKPNQKMGGVTKKAAKGGSFPDLNKDGKITKADILKGRGVIAKKGMKVKKAQSGAMQKIEKGKPGAPSPRFQMEMQKFKYKQSMDKMKLDKEKAKEEAMRPKGLKVGKKGVKMTKKCAYGCK